MKEKNKSNLLKRMILNLTTLQKQIIWDHHDYELTRYLGYTKTYEPITKNY